MTATKRLFGTVLIAALTLALVSSWKWPLIGDESLMHYVVFLMHRGMVPYRDIAEVNLPGTYVFEALFMGLLGWGSLAWRLYDMLLLASAAIAFLLLAGRQRWFAAVLAASTFALLHIKDGVTETGQRDLLIAAILLWSYLSLFRALGGKKTYLHLAIFGFLLGSTFTIKPTLLPLFLLTVVFLAIRSYRASTGILLTLTTVLAGALVPLLIAGMWLHLHGAFSPFLQKTLPLLHMHAELGRKPYSFLIANCLSPFSLVFFLWLGLRYLSGTKLTSKRIVLILGLIGAILGFVLQGKGFTYQRYPELAVFLLILSLDVDEGLSLNGTARYISLAICVVLCFFFAPYSAWLTTTFSGQNPFQDALAHDLALYGSPEKLSKQVQCLDMYSGCIATLYAMRAEQSTGFLYDCYLFHDETPETIQYRANFWEAYTRARPRILVVTNQFCFGDPEGFHKIDRWPELGSDIRNNYHQATEWSSAVETHFWKRHETPAQFRIYVRNDSPR